MKVQLICIGKTSFDFVSSGISLYEKRLQHYISFEWIELQDIKKGKGWDEEAIKNKEGELLLKNVPNDAILVLLDVAGKHLDSVHFSEFINKQMVTGKKTLTFVIGGAYGFSQEVYRRTQFRISLSKMTFSHQIVRLLFAEQLYRAFTILRGEPYHHE